MATHSSIVAWEILWIEERGGLQPIESQTVGDDFVTECTRAHTHTHTHTHSKVRNF